MTALEIVLIIYSIGVSIGMYVICTMALKAMKSRTEAWKQAKECEERLQRIHIEYLGSLIGYNEAIDRIKEKYQQSQISNN